MADGKTEKATIRGIRVIWGLYAKLALAAALLLALGVAVYKIDQNGYDRATAEFTAQRLQEANEANNAIARITLQYREKEAKWAQQSAAVSKTLQVERSNHESTKLAALAAVDAGTLRLRLTDPNPQAGRDCPASVAASTSGNNGAAEGRFLGPIDSAFLIAEASRADQIVSQLTACQAIIIEDRK